MATYGNQTTEEKRQPRTDYANLIHNGKKYDNIDAMVTQLAKERANTAFKSTKLILTQLKVKKTDKEIASAMIEANKLMISNYLAEKAKDDAERLVSREMFGLN